MKQKTDPRKGTPNRCYHPDRIRIVFDDHRLVANAGLLLPGLGELVDYHLDLGDTPGRANTGDGINP